MHNVLFKTVAVALLLLGHRHDSLRPIRNDVVVLA